jgi:L-gulonate 3-dehydrogenase
MKKAACIGAGLVGHAWAVVFARAGHEVTLYDAKPGEVEQKALPGARRILALLEEMGLLDEPVDAVAARMCGAATIAEAVAGVDYESASQLTYALK